jgi:hypothetical protein
MIKFRVWAKNQGTLDSIRRGGWFRKKHGARRTSSASISDPNTKKLLKKKNYRTHIKQQKSEVIFFSGEFGPKKK